MDHYLQKNIAFARLVVEYEKYKSLVIAYDLDNTVKDYHDTGDTYPQMIKLLQDLKSINCYLICFTASDDTKAVEIFLNSEGIPFDAVNENPPFFKGKSPKIYYNALLDDRAGLRQVYDDLTDLFNWVKQRNAREKKLKQ